MTVPESVSRLETRRRVLLAHGARPGDLDRLLDFCACKLDLAAAVKARSPLADQPHVAAWREYEKQAAQIGVWEALRTRLMQFNFPVREGISSEDEYRAATLRGVLPQPAARSRLRLDKPESLELLIHPSIGGAVPVLVTDERADFELLVRALTTRGEPSPVPTSMGACLVSGLNNWDRIHTHRREWEARTGNTGDEALWQEEFKRFRRSKESYQDRLIVLSRGPYSGVGSEEVGLSDTEWLQLSHRIRLEHECTHYFTLRMFGRLQHNIVEELVADWVGLVTTYGHYRVDLAARFLGLENFPLYRRGGRLENYRGDPPLPDKQFRVIQSLVNSALGNLERLEISRTSKDNTSLAQLVLDLVQLPLEELADQNLSLQARAVPSGVR